MASGMKEKTVNFCGAALVLAAAVFAPFGLSASEGGELLWWMVGETKDIQIDSMDGNKQYLASDLGITNARIRYDGEGDSGYLTLWGLDNDNEFFQVPDSSAGVMLPAEYYGSLSGLNAASYSFAIELGNWSDGRWTSVAESDSVSYADLFADRHIATWDNLSPVDSTYWSPSSYTVVPEPASAPMLMLGAALLALRRRRFDRDEA